MGHPRPLLVYFRSFQVNITILQHIDVKNPGSGAGIQTHYLWYMNLPLDQGSSMAWLHNAEKALWLNIPCNPPLFDYNTK